MPEAKSAAEAGPRPLCVCHQEPMRWNRRHDCLAGGYWRCRVIYRDAAQRWRKDHAEELRDYNSSYRVANRAQLRTYMYKWRYGTTKAEHDALFEAQRGLCAICELPAAQSAKGVLHIDHDHATGRVRGLLCNRCNSAIERMDHVPGWLERASAYLLK